MPGSVKAMVIATVAALVMVVAYTASLGGSGWLWFGWIVLAGATAAAVAVSGGLPGRGRRG
ncbi:hypothetical protein [Streptomyces zingiberis]|uniref:DUF4175 domain-containing protein n=1 Tax=Streptomyces zingiberis TaxID=2053010 RepID=A0ABX1BVA7_9ACTN|nr:hypothetical protein [Streptomyces zingiberis]NJQ01637.1 hypothetical protein [Streptomyces zingiberis]